MQLVLRLATHDDLLTVYNWANDPLVRQSSFSTEPIKLESHSAWYESKMADGNCTYLILLADNEPAGQLRYDKNGDEFLISFGIGANFRGIGLGSKLLEMGELYLLSQFPTKRKKLVAYVKTGNKASVCSFERNNYHKNLADENVHADSFIFTKDIT